MAFCHIALVLNGAMTAKILFPKNQPVIISHISASGIHPHACDSRGRDSRAACRLHKQDRGDFTGRRVFGACQDEDR
jgi:hypothetical protein